MPIGACARLLALVTALALLPPGSTRAQEEETEAVNLPYAATVAPSGDATLDAALRAASGLIALQTRAPTDAEGLLSRIAAEAERLRPVLESEGYWAGQIVIIAPDARLDATAMAAAPRPLALVIIANPGPRYTLRRLESEGGPPVPLSPGAPARAEDVLAAQEQALQAMRLDARPLARIERAVTVDHAARAMDIRFQVTPGPRADFSEPTVTGTERVNPEVVRRTAAQRLAGNPFSPERLTRARTDVSALGPFGSVRLETGTALDGDGRLPVSVAVRERAFRAITASAAYETNFGASLRLAWEHRNLLGNAENLRLEAEASRLGNALDRTNARVAATFRQPLPFGRDGTLVSSLAFLRERLDSYDRDAALLNLLYERRLSDRWTLATGPTAEIGQTGEPGGTLRAYQVAGWAVQARYDSTDNPLDPRRGIRASASLTPSYAFEQGSAYVPLRVAASYYYDIAGDGRSILAVRGTLGSLLNARADDVPRSQRFYAGGGGSVRGYDFQSIGPRDARNRPAGGASLLEGSVELRQRFGRQFGAVAFIDAGAVGTSAGAPTDALRAGAGLGLRYYTPIGPIRADIAVPLVKQAGNSAFGLYVGIGHAF